MTSSTSGEETTLRFAVEMLSEEQQARLRHAFNQFDRDSSGSISSREMLQVLRLLGSNPTHAEFENILTAIDSNNDGIVDFREFAHVSDQCKRLCHWTFIA